MVFALSISKVFSRKKVLVCIFVFYLKYIVLVNKNRWKTTKTINTHHKMYQRNSNHEAIKYCTVIRIMLFVECNHDDARVLLYFPRRQKHGGELFMSLKCTIYN